MKRRISVSIRFAFIAIISIMTYACGNAQPVADAGSNQEVIAYSTVILNGSNSNDADGDTLSYNWSLVTVPPGSMATLSDTTGETPTFRPDIDGIYQASLVVSDGSADSAADSVTIVVFKRLANTLANIGFPDSDLDKTQIVPYIDSELIDELTYCD